MSKVKTVRLEKSELTDLISALDAGRNEIADLCGGIGAGALSWWRYKERVPLPHFERMARALAEHLVRKTELKPYEERAKQTVQARLGCNLAELINDHVSLSSIQLAGFLKAMEWQENDLTKFCGVGQPTLEGWKLRGHIPVFFFKKLVTVFDKRHKAVSNSDLIKKVRNDLKSAQSLYAASGSAMQTSKDVHSKEISDSAEIQVDAKGVGNFKTLESLSDKDLIHELQRRGWRFTLEHKDTV